LVPAVAAGDLGQFVVDGELSVPPDQLARQSTAGVVALFEGEGVAGGLLRRLVLPLGFQAAGIPGDLQSMAVAGKAFEPAEQVVGVGGFSAGGGAAGEMAGEIVAVPDDRAVLDFLNQPAFVVMGEAQIAFGFRMALEVGGGPGQAVGIVGTEKNMMGSSHAIKWQCKTRPHEVLR